jgi:NADPH:quinone reductase-like Zn-dependent oxidoreductase
MNAIQVLGPKTSPTVSLNRSQPLPTPDPNTTEPQILIRVHSAGLTGDELTWPELYWDSNPSRIPGHDISGVVAALPPTYTGPLSVGDPVYAMLHADRGGGGQADYVYARPDELAPKPASLSHAQAAALPIPALTAWEALFKRAWPSTAAATGGSGEARMVLVTGASGAVGSMVVQLAKKVMGAKVVALASPAKHGYLRDLGADETVDYSAPDWEREVGERSVDAVFDAAGGEVLSRAWATVKDDGVVVTIADPPPPWAFDKGMVPKEQEGHSGVRYLYFILSPDSEALGKIGGLIDDGALKPLPVVEFSVDKAVEAWESARQRGRNGKVVVNFVTGA